MKVSGAIFSAAWINSTAVTAPQEAVAAAVQLRYRYLQEAVKTASKTASKKRWKLLPRSGEYQRIYANELPCSGDAAVCRSTRSG